VQTAALQDSTPQKAQKIAAAMYATKEKVQEQRRSVCSPAVPANQAHQASGDKRFGVEVDANSKDEIGEDFASDSAQTSMQGKTDIVNNILSLVRQRELLLEKKRKQYQSQKHQKYDEEGEIQEGKIEYEHPESNTGINETTANLLSPHDSAYEALNNPQLNRGIDMSNIETSLLNSNINATASRLTFDNINQAQFQFQFREDNNTNAEEDNNMEFSITSWQNISSHFGEVESRSNSTSLYPFKMTSNNDSNIISSGNESPVTRHGEFFNTLDSPGRVESPNVTSSILSTSSDHEIEYHELEQGANMNIKNDTADKTFIEKIFSTGVHHQLSSREHDIAQNQDFEPKILFGEDESPSSQSGLDSDTEVDHTVDSSTIISSFVMPRVSLIDSNSFLQSGEMGGANDRLRVKIVGDLDGILLRRFKSYNKLFKNITFVNETMDASDLILLVITKTNCNIPKICKTPCIPIAVGKQSPKAVQKIPKTLRICTPITLGSLNDDMISLVDFLNNVKGASAWRRFLTKAENTNGTHKRSLSDITSTLIKTHSQSNSTLASSYVLGINDVSGNLHQVLDLDNSCDALVDGDGDGTNVFKTDDDNKKCINEEYRIRNYLIAGVAFGVVSMGIIFLFKRVTPKDLIKCRPKLVDLPMPPAEGCPSLQEAQSSSSFTSLFDFAFDKLKSAAQVLETCRQQLISDTVSMLEGAKKGLFSILHL
jgi:hypothetical protein